MASRLDFPKSRPLPIIPALINSFRVVKKFPNPTDQQNLTKKDKLKELDNNKEDEEYYTTGIDFFDNGMYATVTAMDDSISLVECTTGTIKTSLFSKKYGVGPLRTTHTPAHVIFASNPKAFQEQIPLRYLSLIDNKFIRYFYGHTDKVTSLEGGPFDEVILSSGLDKRVRLWDLRVGNWQSELTTLGQSSVGFDPTGKVIAVADQSRGGVTLYDIRKMSAGGFNHFPITTLTEDLWTSVRFGNDSEKLIVSTNGQYHHCFDAYDGNLSHPPLKRSTLNSKLNMGQDITLTPNGRFLLSGNLNGTVDIWDLELNNHPFKSDTSPMNHSPSPSPLPFSKDPSLLPNKILTSNTTHPITALGFNPSYMTLLSGSKEFCLWGPNLINLDLNDNSHVNALLEDYLEGDEMK